MNQKSSRRTENLDSKIEYDNPNIMKTKQSSKESMDIRVENVVDDRGRRGRGRGGKAAARVPLNVAKTTIDRIIYPVQTKRGLKYPKKKQQQGHVPKELVEENNQLIQRKNGKLLDGFLILYSCRVKLPHEAIKSKLDSQNIMEVIEEDLCYFQNLCSIDLSDNHVRLEQLRNLKSLNDVNLQYNYIRLIPQLQPDDFERLETLNLSYNSISPASIRSLYSLKKLKVLDLQANNLVTIPEDIGRLSFLEDLNMSLNQFSSGSSLVNPSLLFKALGQIPRLKRLNLSRNKFQAFHPEMLNRETDYQQLQDLDFSYNIVSEQEAMMFLATAKHINLVVITGNPFALQGPEAYA